MAKFFERNSTKLTISEFYDNYLQEKYDFDVSYQRNGGIWSEDKRSFLIDSIMKNYPIPAIFMRPVLDNNGRTKYDIIDGKQRLQSIVSFIKNEIPLTLYFSEDEFLGDEDNVLANSIAGKTFDEIKETEKSEAYIKQFWTYPLQIEYLYEENEDFIASVFDRLNRNGEPLTRQELRNAKYSKSHLIKIIKELVDNSVLQDKLTRFKTARMEDEEFISELLFLLIQGKIIDSEKDTLDAYYEKYCDDKNVLELAKNKFIETINFMDSLDIDYNKNKRICGRSHLYTLFSVCSYCTNNNIEAKRVKKEINYFYDEYFSKNTIYVDQWKEYKQGASSRTGSVKQREARRDAILDYCKIKDIDR